MDQLSICRHVITTKNYVIIKKIKRKFLHSFSELRISHYWVIIARCQNGFQNYYPNCGTEPRTQGSIILWVIIKKYFGLLAKNWSALITLRNLDLSHFYKVVKARFFFGILDLTITYFGSRDGINLTVRLRLWGVVFCRRTKNYHYWSWPDLG